MVTKEQAMSTKYGATFHYTGRHECAIVTGPRGGITETCVRLRASGRCQTWKTRPADFRLPVKFGLRESYEITQHNAADFHAPADCPAGISY